MKKMISILLILTVIFIAGCSTTNEKEDIEKNNKEVTEKNNTSKEESKNLDPNAFVEFEGVDFNGNTVTNDIFKNNKLTMINIWGTNCGPCIHEIPYLEEIDEELSDKGFQMIGFLSGGEGYKEEAIEILDELGADYMNLIVPKTVFSKLRVQAIPTSFLIDSEGKVVEKRIIGALTKEQYLEKINKYLE